jgi:hypothetical protein
MIAPLLDSLRAIHDPLRGATAAGRWLATLPAADTAVMQKKTLALVGKFAEGRRDIGPGQVEALLKIDARLEQVIAELTRDYTANYQKSTDVEVRLWHRVIDLVKAFTAAYQAALRVGYPRADDKRWRAVLPWVLVRLAYYKGLDGKFRLFRYSRWIPAQWREFHELYEFARMRGWQREQLVFGAGKFSRPGVCLEQEYLKTLLLMRLDSGNFTADQVEWIAQQLEDWSPTLVLEPPPGDGASFFVDLTGTQGLRRQDRPHTGGRVLFLDANPVYTRIIESMRWLPDQEGPVAAGALPAREQRLLLVRLAALFGPDALAIAPRAARYSVELDVRVVFGLQALCAAIRETDGRSHAIPADQGGADREGAAPPRPRLSDPDSINATPGTPLWRMVDASDTGCRLSAHLAEAPAKLGELLAVRDRGTWSIGVVRRIQRNEPDEVSLGVEIIARRLVLVKLRNWTGSATGITSDGARSYYGIYLPAHADNRAATQRSLIGPDDHLASGGMAELETGKSRYLIRFTQTLEHQVGWSWALFSAVRNLSS